MLKALANIAGLAGRDAPTVGQTPHEVVHHENKWRLLRFAASGPRRFDTPILIVPSLINRWYVLDLMPGRSLVEWLSAQGHDVYVIDWGTPGPEDRYLRFDDVVGRYVRRALRRTCTTSEADKAHVLGYCMGGTLAVIHASVEPRRVASLTALAAPVSFEDDDLLSIWSRDERFRVDRFVRAFGNAPWPLLQAAFTLLKPTLNLGKMMFLVDKAFVEEAWNDEFLNGFFAKERWANDNVSLPGEVFRTWISGVYRENGLVRGTLKLGGHAVDLASIEMPVHVVSFEDDYIVPKTAAQPLADLVSSVDVTRTHLRGGHIGAVVSKSARRRLWPVLENWWAERDGATVKPSPVEAQAETSSH